MAEQWRRLGKYAPSGTYTPDSGDLVFFKDNTVGIVSEVQSSIMVVISGDVENSVKSSFLSLNDTSIAGWGLVGAKNGLSDVSVGPIVHISVGGTTLQQMRRFSLRSSQTVNELLPYLETHGGSYFFTLLDKNNQELPKDANGNYIAQANTGYKLTTSFNSPEGFLPGVYQYQIPNGLMVDGGEGNFNLSDGTNVGNWHVTDTGLITLYFNV